MYERLTDLAAVAAKATREFDDDAEKCVAIFRSIVGFRDSCPERLFRACGGLSDAAAASAERDEIRIESAPAAMPFFPRVIVQSFGYARRRTVRARPSWIDTADLFVALCRTVPGFGDWAVRRPAADIEKLEIRSREVSAIHAVQIVPGTPRSKWLRWLPLRSAGRARESSRLIRGGSGD